MINDFFSAPFPTLDVDNEFLLREQDTQDAEAFLAYYSHKNVGQHILAAKPDNLADARTEIHYCQSLFPYHKGIYWTLASKHNNQMIGAIGIYVNIQHKRGEICYDLNHHYWNQGIMTRAMRVVIDFCFNKMGLVRLEASTLQKNSASIALLKKLNFQFEGTLKKYRYYNHAFHDIQMYALIAPPVLAKADLVESVSIHEPF